MDKACTVSRRSFLKGATVATGIALAGGAYEIAHPEGSVAADTPLETKYTYCDMCNHIPKCGIAAHIRDGKGDRPPEIQPSFRLSRSVGLRRVPQSP